MVTKTAAPLTLADIDPNGWYAVAEYAALFRLTKWQAHKHRQAGVFRCVKLGAAVRIPGSEFFRLAAAAGVTVTETPAGRQSRGRARAAAVLADIRAAIRGKKR